MLHEFRTDHKAAGALSSGDDYRGLSDREWTEWKGLKARLLKN
jgi:hypothetical protein